MDPEGQPDHSAGELRRLRVAILALGLLAVAAKLLVAATTTGTDDLLFFETFARAIGKVGPVAVYHGSFPVRYNHPPLTGLLLGALDWLTRRGVPFRLAFRSLAIAADLGSTLLVFEVLARRVPARTAAVTAALVAVNPVMAIISAFHGNTDGLFVFLLLLAAWLLLDRDAPAAAGLALAAAAGIKPVPLLLVPVFAALLARRPAARRVRFGAAFAAATAALWAPALARELPAVRRNVLGYAGHQTDWGVVLLVRAARLPQATVAFLAGPGRWPLVVASVLPAALWAWRRPERGYAALALSLVSFLVLTPAWATQYLVWPVVFGHLWQRRWVLSYTAAATAVLGYTYTRWSGRFPWDWAHPRPADRATVLLGLVAWLVLVAWSLRGLRQAWRDARPRQASSVPAAPADPAAAGGLRGTVPR